MTPSTFQKNIQYQKKPIFSGNIEDADDFVYQFHNYLHHFAHPPNEENIFAPPFYPAFHLIKETIFTISFFLRGGYIQAELLYHSMKYY